MNYYTKALVIILCYSILNSCDRPQCDTTNSIFLNNHYSSNSYKLELANQINTIGQKNLKYWLKDFVEKDNNEYLVFYIQNDSLCASIELKMNNWNKLEYLKKVKGKGRFNAEFKGLRFNITNLTENEIEFIYLDFDKIID